MHTNIYPTSFIGVENAQIVSFSPLQSHRRMRNPAVGLRSCRPSGNPGAHGAARTRQP